MGTGSPSASGLRSLRRAGALCLGSSTLERSNYCDDSMVTRMLIIRPRTANPATHARLSGNRPRLLAVVAVTTVVALLWPAAGPAGANPGSAYVNGWGPNGEGQSNVPVDLDLVEDISAGYDHTLALQTDGTVRAWGADEAGETDVPDGLEDVVAVAAGTWHSLALLDDGTVTGWGSNNSDQLEVPDDLEDVTDVAASRLHNLALSADGTVTGWGANYQEQLDIPEDLGPVTGIAAGRSHNMVLVEGGTVREWGERSEYGDPDEDLVPRPEELPPIVAVSAGAG